MEFTALKVKIKKKNNGQAKYPNFNELEAVKNSGTDWSKYIDIHGEGWCYDKKYGHRDVGPDSPRGEQWGVIISTEEFAKQAETVFPDCCQIIEDEEMEVFYDERATIHMPEEIINERVLSAIAAKRAAGVELSANDLKALDPEDDVPGITKNKRKKWKDYKAKKGLKLKKK